MNCLNALIKRDIRMFFKDKGMFITSLITPMILLVLYATFLGNVYRESFRASLQMFGVSVSESLIDACVGGQLFSSLLAVCCVTVSFCSNMLMVQDKVNRSADDIFVSPARSSAVALGYYIATVFSSLIICFAATVVCLIYIASCGWYLSAVDIMLLILDIFLLVMFGTALSSVINFFLTSQGQISAVGTIISAGYGFICGAYMPVSQFAEGLQRVISFLPGTYGTSLLRNHALRGTFAEMERLKFPEEAIMGIRDSIDCNVYFFDNKVPIPAMYAILIVSVLLLLGVYVMLNILKGRKSK